ncbi:MAG TPA: alpha/beta fold hydrolase [Candidatus Aphodousia gallistercoris]|nr:alpha/beta fold hydrolase [Candidatus Aphodousia gallistercoris]
MLSNKKTLFLALMAGGLVFSSAQAQLQIKPLAQPITLVEQGSFAAGGTVVQNKGQFDPYTLGPEGQTLHGDHAYVFYQVPQNATGLPLVFLHGAGQSGKTWETTPDGREGFQTIFLRKGYPVYLVDQPRRGRAGNATVASEIAATPMDQTWFDTFRVGLYPKYFDNVAFPKDPESLNQYFRQITPNTGAYDPEVISTAMAAVFEQSGDGVLVTHSQGGGIGWLTAMKSDHVKAVISYEPGSGFVFPEGEVPEDMPALTGTLKAEAVSRADFLKLTRMPIVIYYGDNIPNDGDAAAKNPGQDNWRVRVKMARLFVDKINALGGQAELVMLPEQGLAGNTHFPFSDLNNEKVADLMQAFLVKHHLGH